MSNLAEPYEELLSIADRMGELAKQGRQEDIEKPLESLKQAAEEIGRAWSGSWIGYHANVYYEDMKPPPPGDHFSLEWGPTGNWTEFDPLEVRQAIFERAGNPNFEPVTLLHKDAVDEFDTQRLNALSVLQLELTDSEDLLLKRLKGKIDSLSLVTLNEERGRWRPERAETRDATAVATALADGTPPQHIDVLTRVSAIQHTLHIVAELGRLTRQAAEHILRLRQRQQPQQEASGIVGTRVFIGHGRSLVWLQLKDFLENTLRLQVEEFNSVPTAGRANKERLLEMMDEAAFALLVMTGDDEFRVVNGEDGQIDTRLYPRLNVVHEAGLFQGRLGFERAIVLLEEGCEAFSNIEGVTQIRFPRDDIGAKSEEIRRVLEREGLLSGDG